MKYYLIVGEASGDLHASHLMSALKRHDEKAEFRFFGGDNMAKVGGTLVRHYKDIAYMGFVPVLMHLRTIFRSMDECKKDILQWQPDVVIPVDYAGFNLKIARFLRDNTKIPVYYFIAPKIWAWKEYRIKNFKRDVDEMFCIFPFETDFFEGKHHYPVHYVGNPTSDEVRGFMQGYKEGREEFCKSHGLSVDKPIVALLAGSRKQEIKDNLPAMIDVSRSFPDYQFVLACAPSVDDDYYAHYIPENFVIKKVKDATYPLLRHAVAALVTSGTATLETACFNVPQVVCYNTPMKKIYRWAFEHIIKCKYISLVNLVADSEVVPELLADRFSVANIKQHLASILPGGEAREDMLQSYKEVHRRLGNTPAPDNAAAIIVRKLYV